MELEEAARRQELFFVKGLRGTQLYYYLENLYNGFQLLALRLHPEMMAMIPCSSFFPRNPCLLGQQNPHQPPSSSISRGIELTNREFIAIPSPTGNEEGVACLCRNAGWKFSLETPGRKKRQKLLRVRHFNRPGEQACRLGSGAMHPERSNPTAQRAANPFSGSWRPWSCLAALFVMCAG